ncbi:Dihydrolipoamide dehydrogenase [Elusimicrobium minutum Pei191]|uniref:Dihydrolipoyl dehydrogenase n=1 Tax=Elusimicrobium minutum (strain Pei191) TaxID=445932 RepID=B2KEG7_ELUMP|nr:dihydrolipoyl dehydrogenase [Elusimicrobium minutum]ACC98913.1 Dihydrolipoamide dehydrogenase [Elusimicrobium minutum Pei191]
MSKNIVIIGAGPGGYPAALKAASLGAKVTVIEKKAVGGTCLNCGCIPSKSLLDAAHRFDIVKKIPSLAIEESITANPDWNKISLRRKNVIERFQKSILSMFNTAGITYIEGRAKFKNDSEVELLTQEGMKIIHFDSAVLAAGTHPFIPEIFKGIDILDNSNVFDIPKLPQTITILGGGVIGCEFASLFNSLGVKVTIIEMQPALVPGEDETSIRTLTQSFKKRGINILTSVIADKARVENGKKIITLSTGEDIAADEILVAVGRTAHLGDIGLENIGVPWTRRGVEVNPQTLHLAKNIYAVGDVNGLCLLAHAASKQGEVAASNICGHKEVYNNNLIPRAMYTSPEVASAGLNKAQAEKAGYEVKIQRAFFLANGRAQTQDETEGQLQIFSDAKTLKILGAAIAGPNASEMIHIFSVAIAAGMTTTRLKDVVFAHPSLSEIITEALAK